MNKAYRNIEAIQKKVKDAVNSLLLDNGYKLIKEERFGDNQALLIQWTNQERSHAFQLIWDIKENWFDLGEFNRINHLNYTESSKIELFPYSAIGILNRDRYDAKYVEKIKSKIKEKLVA